MGPPYIYQALPSSQSIRLLRLFPSAGASEPLKGQLLEYSLQDMHDHEEPYDALSYVWGETDTTHFIELDGCNLAITANLQTALTYVRHRIRDKLLWVDALCIDQDNKREKEHQIGLMYGIYACASCVVVWLGEMADESDQALEDLRKVGRQWHINTKKEGQISDRIIALFQRPWFERIWVLQEVGAARRVQIRCGHREMDGYAFGIAANLLKPSLEAGGEWQALQNTIRSVAYLMQGSVFRSPYDLSTALAEGICTFGELVDMFHDRKATTAQDKVFALLGMSSVDMSSSGLLPDYTVSVRQLFQRLVEFVISNQISIECQKEEEIAVLKAVGYVLGTVIDAEHDDRFNNMQRVNVHWRDVLAEYSSKELYPDVLMLRNSTILLRKGDLICLLDGATTPTIVRLYHDFSVVVVAAASSLTHKENVSTAKLRVDDAMRLQLVRRDFILIWDWAYPFEQDHDWNSYVEWAAGHQWELQGPSSSKEPFSGDYLSRLSQSALLCMDARGLRESENVFHWTFNQFDANLATNAGVTSSERAFAALLNGMSSESIIWVDSKVSKTFGAVRISSSGAASVLFCWAAGWHLNHVANRLIQSGKVDPNFAYFSRPILSLVANLGSEDYVKRLVQAKADVDARDGVIKNGRTALMVAAEAGHLGVVDILLEAGANLNLELYEGQTALTIAAKAGHLSVVDRLLQVKEKLGPKIRSSSSDRTTFLINYESDDSEAENQLLRARNREVPGEESVQTALKEAVKAGHLTVVDRLLQATANVNSRLISSNQYCVTGLPARPGPTVLIEAAGVGHLTVVNRLLEVGADPNTVGYASERTTPLRKAARAGHLSVIERLLEANANVNESGRCGSRQTVLMEAAKGGHLPVIERLLEAGANPNAIAHVTYNEYLNDYQDATILSVSESESDQAEPSQAQSDQTESDQSESDRAESDQSESDQSESDQSESDPAEFDQSESRPSVSGLVRSESSSISGRYPSTRRYPSIRRQHRSALDFALERGHTVVAQRLREAGGVVTEWPADDLDLETSGTAPFAHDSDYVRGVTEGPPDDPKMEEFHEFGMWLQGFGVARYEAPSSREEV
ncbi:hypothetical protein PFICI_00970 [Pestalotiopsis fici W106-1]|uniref:Heterokaryon incompatibility domain-containing protein n=1 Tax=Pestalotiopsis fici (strain W106-1 / CGMCC3.15140) TaxID=1229662 RepID=W3XNQ6_PESFW|nr:uncharacterized protein PFICI_00970 [Pestalotiopsis fici W106-1]ETS87142.1 hypothetical protein PFICI_00970 [Pestalotiopsis fici W106-1]